MKKIASFLSIGVISLTSLLADYQLILIDKNGNETKKCIKSYSFSNNLESLARQNGLQKDIYSEEETLTNKVYMDKPIYRKVVTIPDSLIANSEWSSIPYLNAPDKVDIFIKAEFIGASFEGINEIKSNNYVWNSSYILTASSFAYGYMGEERIKQFMNKKVVVEYTKTTDNINNSKNTFKSYLHYMPSSSENEELINVDLKDIGVQFLENYTYDSLTGSCIKN